MQAKLNPTGSSRISFPGFQEVLDFTSAGSESSVSVAVNGDTDLEYIILIRNLNSSQGINVLLNNDSGATAYGYQHLINSAGTVSAARGTAAAMFIAGTLSIMEARLSTPSGFIKTGVNTQGVYGSGTTVNVHQIVGRSYNSTSNITSIDAVSASGNFTAGTQVAVYARRA